MKLGEGASAPMTERVPIVEEELQVVKREVETGRVAVRTVIDEELVELQGETTRETVDLVRVPKGHVVDVVPEVRQDGETTIIPIVEERLVVVKQLVLTEEVHVRLVKTTVPVTLTASRRVMRPVIERTPVEDTIRSERNTDD